MDSFEVRRLLAIPALALSLAAAEGALSAQACWGDSNHDCGHIFLGDYDHYIGCTNDPYSYINAGGYGFVQVWFNRYCC